MPGFFIYQTMLPIRCTLNKLTEPSLLRQPSMSHVNGMEVCCEVPKHPYHPAWGVYIFFAISSQRCVIYYIAFHFTAKSRCFRWGYSMS